MSHLTKTLSKSRLQAFREINLTVYEFEQFTIAINGLRDFSNLVRAHIGMLQSDWSLGGRLELLQRGGHFWTAACSQLPTTLEHLHLQLAANDDRPWHEMDEENDIIRNPIVVRLWKPR